MDYQESRELFLDHMLNNAVQGYRSTEQYGLLRENLQRMEEDCRGMFNQDQQKFAEECFDQLAEVSGRQEAYVYRQGMRDCVTLLKELQVLA